MDYRNIHGFNVANKLPSINPRNSASLDLTNNKIYKELQLCNESEKEPNEQQVDYNNEENVHNISNGEEQYEEMEEENIEQECQEEQGEEEYYEEQGEEMEEQINYADNIPKLEHSFNAESKNRLQLSSPLTKSDLESIDKYNLSINGVVYPKLLDPENKYEDFCTGYCVSCNDPKLERTMAALEKGLRKTPKVSTQEDNISNEQNKSLYMNNKPNENCYTVNNIDDFTIENNQRKTENYTIDNQNSFNVSSLDHGWQYFKTYGKDDYRTIQKLGDEIRLYWEGIPENSRQNALNAYISDNTTEMNNIMNENFAQVTPYSSSSTNFNIFY